MTRIKEYSINSENYRAYADVGYVKILKKIWFFIGIVG